MALPKKQRSLRIKHFRLKLFFRKHLNFIKQKKFNVVINFFKKIKIYKNHKISYTAMISTNLIKTYTPELNYNTSLKILQNKINFNYKIKCLNYKYIHFNFQNVF